MGKERGPTPRASERTGSSLGVIALVIGAILLSWPFLIAPHQFLYIRYFDVDTVINPLWTVHDLVNVWSSQFHLGYTHARDLSYVSLQELISVLMAPLGPNLRNRSSLICVSLFVFFTFWWWARIRFPRVPHALSSVAAFFYAANPFAVAMIHDGYSGLLVDYALLPASLLLVEWARRKDRPVLLSLIPIAFLVTGMYTLTSVIVALIGVLIFEYRYIVRSLRESRVTRIALALAFALNVYWIVPLAYDLALHPKQPIFAESGNDIAALTSAGTLTNALLLRSYPEIWTKAYGSRECVSCIFYESPWFVLAMLAIAVVAIVGLLRARRYGLLGSLIASIIVTTGYHYQNEILGIPYTVLMGLPSFDIFRGSEKFAALTAMLYAAGLLYFYGLSGSRRSRTSFTFGAALAVLIVTLPYFSGNLIERSPDRPPHFPNFVVSIPPYYAELNKHRDLLPDDSPTLLLPNTPLAAYEWGAYGNEFVPPYLGKPTLALNYLPQPSWQLELILQRLTKQSIPLQERSALLNALGIGRSLYRDDAAQAKPLPPRDFGREIGRFGALHVLSNNAAFPRFFVTRQADPVAGAVGIATYAGLWHRAARGFYAPADMNAICDGSRPLGIELTPTKHRGVQILDIPLNCPDPMSISLIGKRTVHWLMPAGPQRYIIRSSGAFLAIASRRPGGLRKNGIVNVTPANFGWLGYRFDALPYQHYTIFNESFDPTWQGLVKINGRWQGISNFTIDGFANAWSVPANAPLIIANTLQLLTWLSAAIGMLFLIAYLYVLIPALRRQVT